MRAGFSFLSVVLPIGAGARRVTLSGFWLPGVRLCWLDEQATQEVLLSRLEQAFRRLGGASPVLALRCVRPLGVRRTGGWALPVAELCRHYGCRPAHLESGEDDWLLKARDELRRKRHPNLLAPRQELEVRCQTGSLPVGLRPLPRYPYVSQREVFRRVAGDGFVPFERDAYSVPTSYVGKNVWVQRRGEHVVIRSQAGKTLAVHSAGSGQGEARLDLAHFDFDVTTQRQLKSLKRAFIESFPSDAVFYTHLVAQRRRSAPATLRRILELAKSTPTRDLRLAFRLCFKHNNFSHRFLAGALHPAAPHQPLRVQGELFEP